MSNTRFLLEKVLKVEVLGHAQSLSNFNIQEIFANLEHLKEKLSQGQKSFAELYQLAFKEGAISASLPTRLGGQGLAESVGMIFIAELAEHNAGLGFELLQTLAGIHLLDHYNDQGQFDENLKQLVSGKVQAVIEPADPLSQLHPMINPLKVERKGKDLALVGKRIVFFTPSKEPKIYILLGALPEGGFGCYLVEEEGLALDQLYPNRYLSPIEIEVNGDCKASLITSVGNEDLFKISRLRKYINVLTFSAVNQSYCKALQWAKTNEIAQSWEQTPKLREKMAPMIYHPKVADRLMWMKSVRDGLRAMLFHSFFYLDCMRHGADSRSEYFQDLTLIFELIYKHYALKLGHEIKQQARHILGPEYFSMDDQHLLYQLDLMGGNSLDIAGQTVMKALQAEGGRPLQSLLQEFDLMDAHLAKSEDLKEAINVWRDYVGGLFLLHQDLMDQEESIRLWSDHIYAERMVMLLGDVILTHLLIKEAIEAERELEKLEVNFFNLAQECAGHPQAAQYYNKIQTALYFAYMELSAQEGQIRIIQKSKHIPLESILSEI